MDLNSTTLPTFIHRVRAINADTPRQWGTMDAARAICHLIHTLEISLGIERVDKRLHPAVRAIFYFLFLQLITTWPKGLKGPDSLTPPPKQNFATEQARLIQLMTQFTADLDSAPTRIVVHPTLGDLPLNKWSRAHGVHMDHHLRQFGV